MWVSKSFFWIPVIVVEPRWVSQRLQQSGFCFLMWMELWLCLEARLDPRLPRWERSARPRAGQWALLAVPIWPSKLSSSDQIVGYSSVSPSALQDWDYVFSENGVMAYKGGKLIHSQSFAKWVGEERLQQLINFCLFYMSGLELPVKR